MASTYTDKIHLSYNRFDTIVFCIAVALMIPDVMISYVPDLIVNQLISLPSIAFFITVVISCSLARYFILDFVRHKSNDVRSKDLVVNIISKIVEVGQYILIAVILFLTAEIIFTSSYHTVLLIAAVVISEVLAVVLLGIFSLRFFTWFVLNKKSIIVLLYGMSFALITFSLVVITLYDMSFLPQKEPMRSPQSEITYPSLEEGSFFGLLFDIYSYFDILSFSLLILATAILLHHYSKKVGKIKFWVFVILPLVYFISGSLENFGIYTPTTDSELFYWTLYTSLNSTAGGILFGIAFWTIGRTLRQESAVRLYVKFAAYGFVLYFISNQVSPSAASYPPYGIVSMSFLPLAAYMMFLGLYSTAISISQDNQLRRSVKKLASQNSNLLGSIGTAHMEQEIQKTVKSMKGIVQEQEKELEEQTGIEANLEEDEMKKYLEEVMQEVGKAKKPST